MDRLARDKVSEFMATTVRLKELDQSGSDSSALLLKRDTLLHEIVLHLNPHDEKDQRIRILAERVQQLNDQWARPVSLPTCCLNSAMPLQRGERS